MSPMPPKVETSGYILKKICKQYIETLTTVSTVGPQDDDDMSPMPPKVETLGYI